MRKGTTHSDITKNKIREKLKGKRVSKKTEFKKGHKVWNKGIKGLHLSSKTEFKKGQFVGKNHPSWKGGVQKNKKDCIHLWIGANQRTRRPRKVYEEHFGEIPEDFIIYHRDGNKNNDSPTNLIAISRAELVELNNPKSEVNLI